MGEGTLREGARSVPAIDALKRSAMTGDKDGIEAELANLQSQMAELRAEATENLSRLGRERPDAVNLDDLDAMINAVVQAFHRYGYQALAASYASAYEDYMRMLKLVATFVDLQAERPLTDAERLQSHAAKEALDEISERFERVQADVSTYLNGLRETGSA